MIRERDIKTSTDEHAAIQGALSEFEAQLRGRLQRTRWRLLLNGTIEFLVWGLLWVGVVAIAASLAETSMNDATLGWRRWLLFGCGSAGLLFLIIDRIIRPLLRLGGLMTFSRRLDRDLAAEHLIIAASEALQSPARWTASGAVLQVLVKRTIRRALEIIRIETLPSRLKTGIFGGRIVWFTPVFLMVLSWPLDGPHIRRGLERLLHPEAVHITPRIGLYAQPAPGELQAGKALVLDAFDFGTPRGRVIAQVRGEFGPWRDISAEEVGSREIRPFRHYQARISKVDEALFYRFIRDEIRTPVFQVGIYHPPQVIELKAILHPPTYTGLPSEALPRLPSVLDAPVGSVLGFSGRVNHALRKVAFVNEARDTIVFSSRDQAINGELRITASGIWTPYLLDWRGLINESPISMRIQAVADRDPNIELLRRDPGGLFPADGVIRLSMRAVDDYEIAGISLLLAVSDGISPDSEAQWSAHVLPMIVKDVEFKNPLLGSFTVGIRDIWQTSGEASLEFEIQADGLNLMPGEALLIRAEARDNRGPGPPGIGRSRILRFLMPAAADILTDQLSDQESRLENLSRLRHQAEDLSLDLERINRELKKFSDPDFARRLEASEAVERQASLQEELSRMAESLRQQIDAAASRGMMSGDMIQRMERIGELMESLDSSELDRLQQQMKSAVEKLSPRQIADAIREVAENQQRYLDQMDRTIALLEQMKLEQQMTAAEMMTEDLMRQQQAMTDPSTAKTTHSSEQEDLADKTDEFREFLEKLAAELSESTNPQNTPESESGRGAQNRKESENGSQKATPEDIMREAISRALNRISEQDPAESMRQAAEQMQGESDSSQAQHDAMRQLAALYHILQQGRKSMQMTMQQTMLDALRNLTYELLELSSWQEELAVDIPADTRSLATVELARRQQRILRSVQNLRGRLQALMGMSTVMSVRLIRNLDIIATILKDNVRNLHELRGRQAAIGARNGLSQINTMVINLLTSLQSSGGGGGGSSMPSAAEKLQQMAQTQAGLNGMTQLLQQQNSGRDGKRNPSREQAERLGADQISEQQRRLAEDLLDLDLQSRESSERLLGDLSEMAKDAETIAREIGSGEISEETLRRQERILGRMLDARNSARRRDYENRRRSRSADGVYGRQQGDVLTGDAQDVAGTGARRHWQPEEVPGEYRDLVQRYYDYLRRLDGGQGSLESAGEQ